MSREVDRRDFSVNRVTPAREAEMQSRAAEASDRLPGEHTVDVVSFSAATGNPARVASRAAPAERGDYVRRALNHVQNIVGALGFAPVQPPEFVADPHAQTASSGAVTVHLQQQYKGISIFDAAQAVRFAPDGTLTETAGNSITVEGDLDVAPALSVRQAVLKAAAHVAVPDEDEQGATDEFGEPLTFTSVDLTGFEAKVVATFPDMPSQSTVIEAGPFAEPIKANLLWFPLDNNLRLTWEVVITLPRHEGQYRTLVDAEAGEILYCRQLMKTALARGNVYRVDGGQPRQMTDFPLPLQTYDLPVPNDLPSGFPDHWVAANQSVGNSVNAHLDDFGVTIEGQMRDGVLTFDPADPTGDDQKVLNIFYYNCFMHDFFYLLGFREADGNFQQNNFERGGAPTDPVDARSFSGAVFGTASMATPIDGTNPVMRMGLVTSTDRHTAFDSSVVFHEFTHGVTNRLVGGPMNARALEALQSGGMGEGWSDYIACSINDTTVVGAWVVNRPNGIRGFPYDSNFPDNFGDLGQGRYTEVHNIGEIWCATLLEMNRQIGKVLGVQLVVDALKLSPANPSLLDMRDAILLALDNKLAAGQLSGDEHPSARRGIWTAFAHFGMGPNARSNGASLSGIVADFNLPPDLEPPEAGPVIEVSVEPNLAIPDNQSTGVTSTLNVQQPGKITHLTVSVDIEHTYIGDLQVSLISPGGRTVILHNRSGASTDNISKSYSSDDTPALASLLGEQVQGDWTLKIADLARLDVGTLRRWGLDAYAELEAGPKTVQGEVAPGQTIPDNDPTGISSAIAIDQSGLAQEVSLSLDITHTYIGDLRVELIAPAGQQVMVHNRSGGSRDNLITTYDPTSTPALAALKGQSIRGNWILRVTDLAGRDVGKLNKWSLTLTLA